MILGDLPGDVPLPCLPKAIGHPCFQGYQVQGAALQDSKLIWLPPSSDVSLETKIPPGAWSDHLATEQIAKATWGSHGIQ